MKAQEVTVEAVDGAWKVSVYARCPKCNKESGAVDITKDFVTQRGAKGVLIRGGVVNTTCPTVQCNHQYGIRI